MSLSAPPDYRYRFYLGTYRHCFQRSDLRGRIIRGPICSEFLSEEFLHKSRFMALSFNFCAAMRAP